MWHKRNKTKSDGIMLIRKWSKVSGDEMDGAATATMQCGIGGFSGDDATA